MGIVQVSRHFKEEMAWAIDKQVQVISNIMLFKAVIPVKKQRITLFRV